MRNITKQIFIFLALLTSSCTERIDVELPTSLERLVVDGKFSIDTTAHTVILSKTMNYFESNPEIPYISDANLKITEVETGIVYPLHPTPDTPGHYRTEANVYGVQGYSYKLEIANIDIDEDGVYETYEATDFLPYISDRVDSIKVIYGSNLQSAIIGMPPGKNKGWNTLLYMQDMPTSEYYLITGILNGVPFSNLREIDFFEDKLFGHGNEGAYLYGAPMSFFPDDKEEYKANVGDTIGMIVQSASFKYFRYLQDVKTVNSGGNPMMGNPANIRGNVNNGAIGYFATYSSRSAEAIAK